MLPYMVTFTINIPPMLAYIPYMDPMGKGFEFLAIGDGHGSPKLPNCWKHKEVTILIVSDVNQVDRWELQTST